MKVMTTLSSAIRRRPVLSYFALAFAISWGGVLVVVGGDFFDRTRFDEDLPAALVAMLAGPSVAGIALTALVDKAAGLRALASRLTAWRGGWAWLAPLFAPLVMFAILVALARAAPEFRPRILVVDDKAAVLTFGATVALAAGFFEEIGWTGFALPHLRRRHRVLGAGLILGGAWAAWHLLAAVWFWAATSSGAFSLATLLLDPILFLVAYRVIMVWVYERSRSLLLAMVMHASLTASARILSPDIAGAPLLTFDLVWAATLAVVIAVFAANGAAHRRQLRARAALA